MKEETYMDKLIKRLDNWFRDLNESEKLDILEGIYPNQVGMIDSDELWARTEWETKLGMYSETDNKPTEEELEAAKTDAAERENHRKEVERDIE